MKNDYIFINHILDAIKNIEDYTKNVNNFADFRENNMMFSAVAHEMEIVGEASSNINSEFKLKYPNIPWKKMISMRNVLIHEYFGVNREIVWDTIKNDLPELKKLILPLLNQ